MNTFSKKKLLCSALLLVAGIAGSSTASAQPGAPDTRTPRERALIDITGQWVAVVNEDWRWRMITAPVGDTSSLPVNAAARAAAAAWDIDKDRAEGNLCRAFGAAGLIRQPTRIRVDWEDDATLKLEFDAGQQERLLHFGTAEPPAEHSLQGFSTASWYKQRVTRGVLGGGAGTKGALHVSTTHLAPGYLRPNGVPYSEQTVMKEFIHTFTLPGTAGSWLIVTSIIEDPVYLTQELVLSTQFRKETDDTSGWEPRDCEIQRPRVVRPPTVPGPFG
jgi:hypothetical protein